MKAKKCTIIGNTSWGYCFAPMYFMSIREGKEYAKYMIDNGYWFNYRLFIK